jgi:Spy/CpxP family protein refolding chaperone
MPARQAARRPLPRPNVQEPSPPPAGQIALTRVAILRLLNLSPEQRQRIREIRDRYAPQLRQLRQEVEARRDALREAIYGETVDPERVEQNLRDLLEKQGALLRLETHVEIEFRRVLTPEQLAKFREIQREELNIRRLRRELRQREEGLRERLRRGS